MTYETFVKEMLNWLPILHDKCMAYMDEDDPLPYVAVSCVLNPWLEACLEAHDVANIAVPRVQTDLSSALHVIELWNNYPRFRSFSWLFHGAKLFLCGRQYSHFSRLHGRIFECA